MDFNAEGLKQSPEYTFKMDAPFIFPALLHYFFILAVK